MRIELALRNVPRSIPKTRCSAGAILDIAVAPTIGPAAFVAFFEDALGSFLR